jgi:hypothetical protein
VRQIIEETNPKIWVYLYVGLDEPHVGLDEPHVGLDEPVVEKSMGPSLSSDFLGLQSCLSSDVDLGLQSCSACIRIVQVIAKSFAGVRLLVTPKQSRKILG